MLKYNSKRKSEKYVYVSISKLSEIITRIGLSVSISSSSLTWTESRCMDFSMSWSSSIDFESSNSAFRSHTIKINKCFKNKKANNWVFYWLDSKFLTLSIDCIKNLIYGEPEICHDYTKLNHHKIKST